MTAIACANRTAFGSPLVPEVKIITNGSAPLTSTGHQGSRGRHRIPVRVRRRRQGRSHHAGPDRRAAHGARSRRATVGSRPCGCRLPGPRPRRVVLMPHNTYPPSAAAAIDRSMAGELPSRAPTCSGPSVAISAEQDRGLRRRLSEVLAPGPLPLAVHHRDGVIVHAGAQQLLNGFERHYVSASLV